MRSLADRIGTPAIAVLVWTALAGAASAQSATSARSTTSTTSPDTGYAEFFAQSAFGNVTSQAYGGEVGFWVMPSLQVFGEFGWVRNTAGDALSANAQTIAAGISAAAGNVSYQVRQPVTFGAGGVKYIVPVEQSRIAPYVLAGFG